MDFQDTGFDEEESRDDHVNALREILQELALLGLWRVKFFEHAAFLLTAAESGGRWFFNGLARINPSPDGPACRHVLLAP